MKLDMTSKADKRVLVGIEIINRRENSGEKSAEK
jgi:hypothetical protein